MLQDWNKDSSDDDIKNEEKDAIEGKNLPKLEISEEGDLRLTGSEEKRQRYASRNILNEFEGKPKVTLNYKKKLFPDGM